MPLSTQVRLLLLSCMVSLFVLILKTSQEGDSHSSRAAARCLGLSVRQILGDVPEQEHGVLLRSSCGVL